MAGKVYTIGTADRTPGEFLDLLQSYAVRRIVDVRRHPTGGREEFVRSHLAESAGGRGIAYSWLGEDLGGYRLEGYHAYTGTRSFAAGIESLEDLAAESLTAITCAERLPWRCHRWWIADRLAEDGWEVLHILNEGDVILHHRLEG